MPVKIVMLAKDNQSGTAILDFALHHGAIIHSYTPEDAPQEQKPRSTRSTGVYRVSADVHTFREGSIRELCFQELMEHHKVGDVVKRSELEVLLDDIEGGFESKLKGFLMHGILEPA